jgi:elongation factor G
VCCATQTTQAKQESRQPRKATRLQGWRKDNPREFHKTNEFPTLQVIIMEHTKLNRKLRNIGIIAHVDAGKTTTTERVLYYAGENHRVGDVHDGNTTMDFDPQERRRGITINSAATTVHWRDCQLNIIDTPGHIDFNIEVNRSLRVLDGAVVVFDAVAGVEPQTETNWRLADKYGVPRICFINKLDRTGADFFRVVEMIRERLDVLPLVLQLPIGHEGGFAGVVDLLSMQALVWPSDEIGVPFEVRALPPDMMATAQDWRTRLIETALEQDDDALAAYLDGTLPAPEVLRACIRKGTLGRALVPVLAGSAFKNKGVEALLDAVVEYLPAPGEVAPEAGGMQADAKAPLVALAFKIVNNDHGALTFVRLYRGSLRAGDVVLNANTGKRERIARLYEMHADKKQELELAVAGDIVAVGGLKDTATGHTLCDLAQVVVLEKIQVAEPVIELALEPATQADQQNLAKALHAVVREDPSLRVRQDQESGQTMLAGMGELQLEVTLEKLRSTHGVVVATGAPQVAYRESISQSAQVHHVHKKQTGGPGQFAELVLHLAPLPRGAGLQFESKIVGGAIPREYIPAVEEGVRKAAQQGVLAAFPLLDLQVTLLDGAFHERDSSTLAFELAAMAAFREAVRKALPQLLEPVMAVEVTTPVAHIGDCIGDLNRRRGLIRAQETRGNVAMIEAHVPLKEMFGYIGQLRALSSGRAQFSMQFEHYAVAPANVVADIVRR